MTFLLSKRSTKLVTKCSSAVALPAVALVFFFAPDLHAAGTGLDVQSGRGTGMAAAVTGMIDDSSSIYYNPAGIAQGQIFDAQIGDSLILPSYELRTSSGTTTKNLTTLVPPFQAYVSGGITNHVSLGVGVFTPFGSIVRWPDDWVGRSIVTSSTLVTYDINPTIAYRLGPIRLGLGLQIERGTVDLKKKIATGSEEASTELGADAWGGGANVGVQVDVVRQYLMLGAQYRSAVKLKFDGNAHFDNVPPELQGTLRDQAASTTLVTPDSAAFALASRPVRALVVDAEVVWSGWSKFHSIDIAFPDDASGSLRSSSFLPKNWHDTVNYRIGAELGIGASWHVRAGVLYDPSPSPDRTLTPDIPDADRLNLAVGGSYSHSSGVGIDVGYQLIFLLKRSSTAPELPGEFQGIANVLGISLRYRTPTARAAAPDAADFR